MDVSEFVRLVVTVPGLGQDPLSICPHGSHSAKRRSKQQRKPIKVRLRQFVDDKKVRAVPRLYHSPVKSIFPFVQSIRLNSATPLGLIISVLISTLWINTVGLTTTTTATGLLGGSLEIQQVYNGLCWNACGRLELSCRQRLSTTLTV